MLAFIVTIGTNFAVGFKKDSDLTSVLMDAVNTLAVGILASAWVLLLLNQINSSMPLDKVLGNIVLQTIPLSIGASMGNSILKSKKGRKGDENHDNTPVKNALRNLAASGIGSIFVAFSIAPTMEISKLASELNLIHQIGIAVFSLFLSYLIVYESGFDQKRKSKDESNFNGPFTQSALAYAASLAVAFVSLYFFAQIDRTTPMTFAVSQIIVLGLSASVGAAAGRIVT